MNPTPLFQMRWTRSQRLLGVGFAVVGLAIAADRVRQPNPSVMETIGILVSLLVVVEVLSRATAAIEVTSEAVRAVGGHAVRTIPLGGVTEVKRRGDGVRLALVDGKHIDLDPPVSHWGGSDASHAAAALLDAIESARRSAPQYSTVAGLRRQPRWLSVALLGVTVAVAVWLVLDRWFL